MLTMVRMDWDEQGQGIILTLGLETDAFLSICLGRGVEGMPQNERSCLPARSA